MKAIWIVALALLLSSCSTHFSYNNLDWLIHWYLDDYIELNKAQKKQFDAQFQRWMSWHRSEELKRYQHHLQEIRILLDQDAITREQVLEQLDLGRAHWVRLRTHLVPDLSEMAISMSPQQVDELFANLEEKNAEQEAEYRAMTAEEIMAEYQEDMQDELKDLIGRLTRQQESLTTSAAGRIAPNRVEWIRYRRAFQTAARDMLKRKDSNPAFKADFAKLLSNPEVFQHDSYVKNSRHNREVFARWVADVFSTLTPKQKKRLSGEVDNLIEDIAGLQEAG